MAKKANLELLKVILHFWYFETWACKNDSESGEEVFFTNGGFAEVQPESITILVDSAVRADDLDEAKILKAKEEAEKLLKDKKDQKDFAEVSSQLNQSLSQLRAIEALKKNVKLKIKFNL